MVEGNLPILWISYKNNYSIMTKTPVKLLNENDKSVSLVNEPNVAGMVPKYETSITSACTEV